MKLRLTLLRRPPAHNTDLSRDVGTGRLTIGRGADNDWVLNDPERLLSKNHCLVEFKGGVYVVVDSSTNGVFHNDSATPIGRGNAAVLNDGDRLRLGGFTIGAGFADEEPAPAGDAFLAVLRATDRPAGFGAMAPPSDDDPFGFPAAQRPAATLMPIPDDDELFGPRPGEARQGPAADPWQRTAAGGDGDSWSPTGDRESWLPVGESDHASADLGAMRVAAAAPSSIPDDWLDGPADDLVPHADIPPPALASSALLPDDWDDEPVVPPAFGTRPAVQQPFPPAALPAASAEGQPVLLRALVDLAMQIDRRQVALEALLGLDPDETLDRTASPLRRAVDADDALARLTAEGPERAAAMLRVIAAEGAAHQSALLAAVRELSGEAADGNARLAELYRRLLPLHRHALGGQG